MDNYKFNLAFFTPKAHQLNCCVLYKNSNTEEKILHEEYDTLGEEELEQIRK
jgi:hypothetical protein